MAAAAAAAAAAEFDMKCYIYEARRGGDARGAPPPGPWGGGRWRRAGRLRRIDGPIFIRPD